MKKVKITFRLPSYRIKAAVALIAALDYEAHPALENTVDGNFFSGAESEDLPGAIEILAHLVHFQWVTKGDSVPFEDGERQIIEQFIAIASNQTE